ncbi:MAG: bifunctional metallophosphatase/5'-nucleotidase [Oxalobacter sp.]|nr:MAG: bifunctional metallophosphatase/5'-nucleotidase [Oxalobacter sp.]
MSTFRRWGASVLVLLASALLASCVTTHRSTDTVTVSLISFNDFHGNLLPPKTHVMVEDPVTERGVRVPAGGASYLSTLVKQLQAQNPGKTIIVAAGDVINGSPQVSGMFHDEPTIEAMNLLGLSVSSVGNHEFDRGKEELLRMQRGGCSPKSPDGTRGIVGVDTCMNKGKFIGAKFQYLAANVIDQATGKTLLPSYVVRTVGGVKMGFIGVTLKETPAAVMPSGVVGLRFEDEVETVNKLVPVLEQQGVEVVVVLLHQGAAIAADVINDKSCPGFNGDAIKIVDRLDPAVKVVVTGHTHEEFVCRRYGKLITQAGHYGRMVTKIDLVLNTKTRELVEMEASNHVAVNDMMAKDASGKPVPLPEGLKKLEKDPAMEKLVQRYAKLTAKRAKVVVANIAGYLDRKQSASGESTLANVIADAYLAATANASYGAGAAQIAFVNPGGIRSDWNASLKVTAGDLYSVHPFNNNMVTMRLTGEQIRRVLEQQWEQPQPAGGRVLGVSSGFTYTWDASQPEGAAPGQGRRVVADSLKLHGQPIDTFKTYRVTVNSFLAEGGDNFTVFESGSGEQDGMVDREALAAYLRAHQPLSPPVLARIKRLN